MVFLLSVLCLVFVVVQRISGNVPSFFGYKIFRVVSPSMEPEMMVGDVVLARRTAFGDIRAGDILVYHGAVGEMEGSLILHEVVETPHMENGEYNFLLKGLANPMPDPPVNQEQVIARYERTIPALTVLFKLCMTPWGLALCFALPTVMIGSGLLKPIRPRRGKKPAAPEAEGAGADCRN